MKHSSLATVGEECHPRHGEELSYERLALFARPGVTLQSFGKALWVFTEAKGEYCITLCV
jgi:hypothetical protein